MTVSKESIKKEIEGLSQELKRISLDIHDNPEIALTEYKACKWLSDMLIEHGFSTEIGVDRFQTAFTASYKSKKPGPVIAFLAEYDALPGIGHGCGHNLIGTASVGAGIASRSIADEFGGEIRVYGTPAEENSGTKAEMVDLGVFSDCDVTLMAHPGYLTADNMNGIALQTMVVEFFGKASHAGGAPEEGVNALDAVINVFNMLNAMRQQIRSDARIHGIIEDGGKAPNIIPDYTRAVFYVRAKDKDYCSKLYERLADIVKGAALGTGCTWKISKLHHDLDDIKQNLALSEIAASNMESFGEPVLRMKNVYISSSSDEGNVSQICPSMQFVFKIGEPDSGNDHEAHTLGFARDAGSEEGLNAMIRMSKVLAMTAYDLLSEPENMKKVKDDFENRS